MAGYLKGVNLREVGDALWQYFEDEASVHQDLVEEFNNRNQGLFNDYLSRNRSLWSRLLGRLREAGMDAPEAILGALGLVVASGALSFLLTSRRR